MVMRPRLLRDLIARPSREEPGSTPLTARPFLVTVFSTWRANHESDLTGQNQQVQPIAPSQHISLQGSFIP